MIKTIYIEEQIANHPRTQEILARFPDAMQIYCERYGEIFNRKAQSFRLQKKQPALILAKKHKGFVLPAPEAYSIGAKENYYFSHMMNCLYDCRYCFLQGMYRSAHYVLFVNYEDFANEIKNKIQKTDKEIHFFSGYDCDSLALEPVTKFLEYFLPVFRKHRKALLEIRTKSTQIRTLLNTEPFENCVLAWSFTPAEIAAVLEHKTPSVDRRIISIIKLQEKGWRIGLRFDPLIYSSEYQSQYRKLFADTLQICNPELLHSVTLGSFRLPKGYFKSLQKMYPDERLFASPLEEANGMFSYKAQIQSEMLNFCREEILNYIPEEKFFPCHNAI
ncbi:MAG: DNA photolyase [Proteobacteria bacterium]|nr:DNA photolyase [Pseudomonadota bacterium]